MTRIYLKFSQLTTSSSYDLLSYHGPLFVPPFCHLYLFQTFNHSPLTLSIVNGALKKNCTHSTQKEGESKDGRTSDFRRCRFHCLCPKDSTHLLSETCITLWFLLLTQSSSIWKCYGLEKFSKKMRVKSHGENRRKG